MWWNPISRNIYFLQEARPKALGLPLPGVSSCPGARRAFPETWLDTAPSCPLFIVRPKRNREPPGMIQQLPPCLSSLHLN